MPHLMPTPPTLLAFGMPGGWEWIILLVLGLLIFGRRLPEVGRSLGKGIVEFKKGIKGIEDEIEDASREANRPVSPRLPAERSETPAGGDAGRTMSQPAETANPYRPADGGEAR